MIVVGGCKSDMVPFHAVRSPVRGGLHFGVGGIIFCNQKFFAGFISTVAIEESLVGPKMNRKYDNYYISTYSLVQKCLVQHRIFNNKFLLSLNC